MACPARGERTKEALPDVHVANVPAKLAVPWLIIYHPNELPIAIVASVLHLIAHFLNSLFPVNVDLASPRSASGVWHTARLPLKL